MNRRNYGDSADRIAAVLLTFLFFVGNVSGDNKEGYYGKYIGKLSQLHHGVSGDVFAVDARTLHLRNFNYDGEGPAAYFYAGNSKAPGVNGFRLRDERGTTNVLPRYRNKHLTITLPEGKTLQNIRWFSVWCDEFSVNFGDVKIPKNLDFPKPQKISGLSGVHGVSSEPIVIVDAQTLLIPSFSYDGEAPDAKFWVGRGFKPSPQGIRIPDENGKELPLRRYDRKTIVLTLPGDLTIFDIGHFGVWCEAFTVDFGHVQIPRGLNIPPSLKMLGVSPQSKLNCEVLWDDFAYEVRWAVAGDSIVLQLVARLENNEYMSFGLSGDKGRSRMVGGDVVVAWVDKDSLKGYAKDYYLDAKSQCSGGRGSCPDDNVVAGTDSVRLLNAALVNGYSIVTFQRSLKAQDELDKHVFTNESQPIIWAIGPLNSRKEVSYHSLTNRGDIFIDFGRPPKWNCPTPESVPDQSELDDKPLSREYEEVRAPQSTVQDSSRRESRPKSQVPTPAPAPKSGAWEIPSIKCYEPEDGVFYAQMGPTGGKHGYSAITGHVGWGISWYINGLLIPEINVVRGRTYTFIVEGGLDPETPARYHPFYITDDPVGGYQYKTPQERASIQIFAGAVQNKRGEVRPTGVGRLCNWTPDPNQPPADDFTSFGAYQRTLRLECDPGNPGIIQWTVEKDTPDTVYYQCYTHRYLGWKINVHDHCEGEAASEPVPAIVKAPPSLLKSQELDSEGSETINYETRVKPDSQFLKNYFGKNQTTRGPNEFNAGIEYRPGFYQKYEEEIKSSNFVVKAPLAKDHGIPESSVTQHDHGLLFQKATEGTPQAALLQESKLVKFAPVSNTPSLSSYLVSEEPLEGINHQGFQNFQIIPISFSQQSLQANGLKNHQDFIEEQVVRIPEPNIGSNRFQEFPKNFQILKAQAEEKLKRHKQKLSHHGKPMSRLPVGQISGPANRQRKPPISSHAFTLQQRPFPPGMFRPPSLIHKAQKRPTGTNSQKIPYHVQAKGPQHHLNIGPAPDDFNRQEPQIIQQIKLTGKQQSPGFSPHDLFASSTVGKQNVAQSVPFALNNGFDPQSVQVEGGFKPILNTGYTPKLNERVDLDAENGDDDNVGVIDLVVNEESSGKQSLVRGTAEAKEVEEKEANLFKNQKHQMFEPIFIPSFPDDSGKKYQEKYKKPLVNQKHRNHEFQFSDPRKNGQLYVKIRPTTNLIRRPFYPDNVVPPFKIPSQGGSPQLRSQQPDDSEEENPETDVKETKNDTLSDDFRAENILEVIQMYEGKKSESEVNGAAASKDYIEGKLKGDDPVQEEIAMADERNDFYLPPKADQFHSYDGKVVKDVDAPTLPESSPVADVSKLPQFVPFKGVTPPLTNPVNAMSLPQLRSSKLARQDILPPSDVTSQTVSQKLPFPKLSLDSRENLSQHRKKRSPDHIPGHVGHDHSDHDHDHDHHHDHHSSSSSNNSHLLYIALASFSAFCIQNYVVL